MKPNTVLLFAIFAGAALAAPPARASVHILSQSATIRSTSSYQCEGEDRDAIQEELGLTDLRAVDRMVASEIAGSCGEARATSHIESSISADRAVVDLTCSASATSVDEFTGGDGRAEARFEIVFEVTEPVNCTVDLYCSGGGQGNSGGTASGEFFADDGTVYFTDSAGTDLYCWSHYEELALPAGTYTLRGVVRFSSNQYGGTGQSHFAMNFLDAVGDAETTFGMLKARY